MDCSVRHARLKRGQAGGTRRWRLGSEFLAPVDHFQICLDEGADAGHMCPSRGGCLAYVFDEYILPIFADFPVKMKRGKALTRGFSRGGNFRGNPDLLIKEAFV